MQDKIIILDFGSQYTQLIARRVREAQVYCEIHPYTQASLVIDEYTKGIILSGSPCSVRAEGHPSLELDRYKKSKIPILGICYGAQLMVKLSGGLVAASTSREYGRAQLRISSSELFKDLPTASTVWMSHGDTIIELPVDFQVIASTNTIPVAAYKVEGAPIYGLQFHPEVTHTEAGFQILKNFVIHICGLTANWTPAHFVHSSVESLKEQLAEDSVVLGLSGGVDSSVAALLLHKAIGDRLNCIFVDNGLLRKGEFESVLNSYKDLGLNVKGVDAKMEFYQALAGLDEPEDKRKAIGKTFIEVFDREAKQLENVVWLAQGTIYPDVIESVSVSGPAVTIKSHHNVGGLPDKMQLKIVEPLRSLFKDEVRKVGGALKLPEAILNRHPFPGPGLAIRILGDVTEEKVRLLQEVDHIFISLLQAYDLYDKIWQAGAILLPIQSVGVMGDERTYERVVALRAVVSLDGMTADWYPLPYEFLAEVSNQIINRVKGINRVVYDISSKPPATIEWE